MKYFILETVDDVEPQLHGPFMKESDRDEAALQLRRNDPEKCNGIFWLNQDANGALTTGSYSGGFLDEQFDNDTEDEVA